MAFFLNQSAWSLQSANMGEKGLTEAQILKANSLPGKAGDKKQTLLPPIPISIEKPSKERRRVQSQQHFVVASVNGQGITNYDVEQAIRIVCFLAGKPFDQRIAKLMAETTTQRLMDDKLRQQIATRLGACISEAAITAHMKEIAKNLGMSIEKLQGDLVRAGINSQAFREQVKRWLLYPLISQVGAKDINISEEEIESAKKKLLKEIKKRRYNIMSLFLPVESETQRSVVNKQSQDIYKLLQDGFPFVILSESLGRGSSSRGERRWISADSLDSDVYNAIKNLQPGMYSHPINAKSGIWIILVIDVAEPGKAGMDTAVYSGVSVSLLCGGALFTEKDMEATQSTVEALRAAKSFDEFQAICAQKKLPLKPITRIGSSTPIWQVLNHSKSTGAPVVVQEDEHQIAVVMCGGVDYADAKVPPLADIKELALANKQAHATALVFEAMKKRACIKVLR